MKIIIAHLEGTGTTTEERELYKNSKTIPFTDIKNAVYQEPFIHHSGGLDVFIVER